MLAYLDHHATTPCDAAVLAAMAPWWNEQFANPSSRLYRPALEAAAAVAIAREQVANALAMPAASVVFTSGATEANNLALKGVAEAALEGGNRRRGLVTLATEHRAVLDPLAWLQRHGFPLTVLPVQADGRVDLERLAAALGPSTLLLSVMAANNEIGVLQPLAAIASLCRERGVLFHCDAAQAVGHIPLAMADIGIDLLSLSGHKLYGPKGVGALLRRPDLPLAPQQHGGGQEGGLRAGTAPVPLLVGLGVAVTLAQADRAERGLRLAALRDRLWQGLAMAAPCIPCPTISTSASLASMANGCTGPCDSGWRSAAAPPAARAAPPMCWRPWAAAAAKPPPRFGSGLAATATTPTLMPPSPP